MLGDKRTAHAAGPRTAAPTPAWSGSADEPGEAAHTPLRVIEPHAGVSISEVIETCRGNTMKALGMVEEALQQVGLEREQIECIAVGLGPGSYAGIRAAIALAQGWQLAREVRLLGLSSAECIAAQAQAHGLHGAASVVIDAQRGEFYLTKYQLDPAGCREIAPLRLATKAEVHDCQQAGDTLVGPEVTKWFPAGRTVCPRAAMLITLALDRTDFIAGEKLEPIYLREAKFVKAPPARTI